MKSFPVFRGRNSHTFLKQPAEIELVIDSYHCGDFLERKPVVFDHGGGFSYSEIVQITGDACSYLRFKNTAQIAGT